jgi:hypothetical protein
MFDFYLFVACTLAEGVLDILRTTPESFASREIMQLEWNVRVKWHGRLPIGYTLLKQSGMWHPYGWNELPPEPVMIRNR